MNCTENAYIVAKLNCRLGVSTLPRISGDSYSNSVTKRILQVLADSGPLKRTQLAGKAGVNYGTCMKYIEFLLKLQWVEVVQNQDNGELVSISNEGIANLRKLQNENKLTPSVLASPQFSPSSSGQRVSATGENLIKMRSTTTAKNIVIVDDDENSLITYAAFLEQNRDYIVRTFSDSRKALEYLTVHPSSYDLVLLDIRMPGMSGLRLFQGIKASNPNARVIFLSSLDAAPELSDIFSDAKQSSMLLRKPVTRDSFLEAVSKAVS